MKGSLGAATFEKAAQSYVIKAGNAIASTTALQHISGVKKEQDTAQNLELTEVSSSTQTPFKNDAGLAEESSRPPKAPGKPHFVPTKVVQDTFSRKVAAFGYGLWLDTLSWKKKTRTTSITGRKIKANGLIQCQGFMEVLDVATEYLKLMTTKQSGFNARVYSTWLLRFAYAVVPAYATYSMISSWVNLDSCHRHGHSTLKSQNERCANINFTAAYSLGFVLEWLTIVLGIMNMTVCFSVLVYSTDVANALTKYWLHRYRELRRISKTEEKRESAPAGAGAGSNKPSSADAGEVTGETVQALIERDAYERYLLTHTYFTEASNQWSVYLFFTLGATFALFLQSYVTILYFYAKYKYVSLEYTILCIVNALVFTMVFACMSYANGAVETMLQGFLYAGANDYALLGGRDVWLEFVEKAPIYWYIFGFAIKKSDVVAYVGGGVSAILGGLVTSIVFADTS